MTATLNGENQITVPAELVEKLGLKPGMKLELSAQADRSLVVRPLLRRGEIARRVQILAGEKLPLGTDPICDLQQLQEANEPAFLP